MVTIGEFSRLVMQLLAKRSVRVRPLGGVGETSRKARLYSRGGAGDRRAGLDGRS